MDRSSWLEEHKPVLAMVGLQFIYAGLALLGKAALSDGMSPWVYVSYRQGIAALAIAPAAYFSNRRSSPTVQPGRKGFFLLFVAALVGITLNQNFYFLGLRLGSPSMATAMTNLIPAITFLMAAAFGIEEVNIRSPRSIAKIVGTVVCVSGAATMALLKGPKLLLHLGLMRQTPTSLLHTAGDDWLMGCLLMFGSCCCWSVWLILQVPINKCFSNLLSLSGWMCFTAFLHATALAFFMEPHAKAWRLSSTIQITCCVYAGIAGSGITIWVQAWCVSRRGPLFSAMFNPLCTVIATFSSFILLHEDLYIGSFVGSVAVVGGLYVVLWGKAEDLNTRKRQENSSEKDLDQTPRITIAVDHGTSAAPGSRRSSFEEPLLAS